MNKKILNLAVPNIISNITVPLLGMVDLALLGHLESELYIGAIALGGIIFNFIYWGFGFLRMGTSGFTAQAYGERNLKESCLILSRSVFIAILAGITLIILQVPIGLLSFYLIEGSNEVKVLAAEYYYIRIYAAPATLSLYALVGWFIGMQNARIPMVIAIIVNVANIIFSVIFIYVFNMKSEGVALGTVLAQYTGLFVALIFFFRFYKKILKYFEYKMMIQWEALRKFFQVNSDILVRTLCLIFVFAFFTNQSAKENDQILAVNTLLLQYLFVFSFFIDGFANAAEALIGKYTGANNILMLRKAVRLLFIWGIGISIPFTLTYVFAGKNLLYILTNNQNVISNSTDYILWVGFIPLVTFTAFIWDGIYIGATATKSMRNTMLIATLIFFLPAYFLLKPLIGNHALWLAMMMFMAIRGILLSLLARRSIFNPILQKGN